MAVVAFFHFTRFSITKARFGMGKFEDLVKSSVSVEVMESVPNQMQ